MGENPAINACWEILLLVSLLPLLRLEDYEEDSLSFFTLADVGASCGELSGIGASQNQLAPGGVGMYRSKSSEVLRLTAVDSPASLAEVRRSVEVVGSTLTTPTSNSNGLRDTSKHKRLGPPEVVLQAPRISLRQEDEKQLDMNQTATKQALLQKEGDSREIPSAQSNVDGPSTECLAEQSGESAIGMMQHDRINSESSSGSNLPFPGACKTEGSDSAFSLTSSSLNTGSRSSWEGLTSAQELVGGTSSVASPTHSQDGSRPLESPRPTSDTQSVPLVKRDSKNSSKDKPDMMDISMGFRELQSRLAGLDVHISQWSTTEKASPSLPATTQHWTSTQEERFADLDSHLEQLTNELTRLDTISSRQPRDSFGKGSQSEPSSSSSTSQDRQNSDEQSQDDFCGRPALPAQFASVPQSPGAAEGIPLQHGPERIS